MGAHGADQAVSEIAVEVRVDLVIDGDLRELEEAALVDDDTASLREERAFDGAVSAAPRSSTNWSPQCNDSASRAARRWRGRRIPVLLEQRERAARDGR